MEVLFQNFDLVAKVVAVLAGAAGFFFALRNEISSLRTDIKYIQDNQKMLQEAFAQLNGILTKVAVQDARLNMIEKKIDELSHGKGYIQ